MKFQNMNQLRISLLSTLCFVFLNLTAFTQDKKLESPYYVFPRIHNQHMDLSGNWLLASTDKPVTSISELSLKDWIAVVYPTSVQMAQFKAGRLGDPYEHLNALEHEKLEQRVWYYKKDFSLPARQEGNTLFLCFDGIDYFAKVWLNGELLGTHEGIFGGPVIDITGKAKAGEQNTLVVQVRSANFGNPGFDWRNPGRIVKGWFLTGGTAMEPYFTLGLWRNVRIEIVPSYHIERPFLYTEKIEGNLATLGLTTEIFAGTNSGNYTLHPWGNTQLSNVGAPKDTPRNKKVKDELKVVLEMSDGNKISFRKEFTPYVIEGRCWLEETFTIPNPRLWFPNGTGSPDFYKTSISLLVNGKQSDRIEFDFGIRTIEQVRSAGIRTGDRWQNWQFVVNGKKLFIKGINWMPVDALYDLTADKYDWAVKMAKNAGIQMFRIWGSGLLESKEFYDACNKYGIMVWQDFPIANFDTPEWPQDVWEAQVCQNIFRLRNQPSLVMWCGGNEFNPYSFGNAASIGILERNLRIFDPTRTFLRASPDAGSIHSYPDFDPSWYKGYELVPFVAETGIHCITDPKTIREVVSESELSNLKGMYDQTFAASHPEFVQHFAEYNPGRVPRMLSRASHIDNMANPALESIAEATQVGAGEFYQVMSEGIQFNYPVTTGLLPWVYKRPWPVVAAINLVDGKGQPSAPYYFLKRTYEPVHVALDIKRLLWAPGENFPVGMKVINGVDEPASEAKVMVEVFDDKFKSLQKEEKRVHIQAGISVSGVSFADFQIPATWKGKYFFVRVTLSDKNNKLLSDAEYWPRTIPQMEDPDFHKQFCNEPVPWPTLDKGPWLKPAVAATRTKLEARLVSVKTVSSSESQVEISISNTGKIPAFMVKLEISGIKRAFYATDNFFWLSPGDHKTVTMNVLWREPASDRKITIDIQAWNSNRQSLEL
jgi:beta-mannosidase